MAQAHHVATHNRPQRAWHRLIENWVRRRAPVHPPITLSYRQIFILPTRFGWMLGLLMGAMLVGSLNFNNNLGLLTTFIVAGLAINSMLLAYRNLHGITIRHGMAAPVFAGQVAHYHLTLAIGDTRERHALSIGQDHRRQPFSIPRSGARDVEIDIPTTQRGWLTLGRMQIETTHPVGLFRAWSWFWPARPILVWPRPAQQPPPLPEGGGNEHGREHRNEPEGEDFHSLRSWREGDPLHRIAWKASQRHQTLLSREFRREQSPNLMLDFSATPGRDPETRISILAAWVLLAETENRQWTLRLQGRDIGPDRGRAHRDRCLRELAEL